jgi:hypothetical protein
MKTLAPDLRPQVANSPNRWKHGCGKPGGAMIFPL